MRMGLTNPFFRPAALIISIHMDPSLQQAVDRSGCRLMSAEHTNTRPAPATNGYAEPPRNLAGRTTVFADVLWPSNFHNNASRSDAATQRGETESKTCLRGECFQHTDWSRKPGIRA
jgi:hypothetical protein